MRSSLPGQRQVIRNYALPMSSGPCALLISSYEYLGTPKQEHNLLYTSHQICSKLKVPPQFDFCVSFQIHFAKTQIYPVSAATC